LALVLPVALALPAPAGIFSKSKPKPAMRVPELVGIVKTDSDAAKRESAAKELREYDSKAFPEMVPVLMDVLQHDASPAVRGEAAQTLSKLRPVTSEVGLALEEAIKDKSFRVRWQARNALMSYRLAGYRSDPKVAEKPQPPAKSKTVTSKAPSQPASKVQPAPIVTTGETPPPPLAQAAPKPLPTAVPQSGPAPITAPKLPKTQTSDSGPDLKP
jgi:hypothetical protein